MGNFSGKHHSEASKAKLARRARASWQNPEVRARRSAAISRSWVARRAREAQQVEAEEADDAA